MRLSLPTALLAILIAACAGSAGRLSTTTSAATDTSLATTTTTAPAPTTTATPETTTTIEPTTTTAPSEPPIIDEAGVYTINWETLPSSPFYATPAAGSPDPFYHIHTNPNTDGFFFSLEMYTTGYGSLWAGEPGEVAILCTEPAPGPNSTGICPHFVPPGAESDLNTDLAAVGSITINQLDENGYDIVVGEIIFSDGSAIVGLHMTG